MTQQLIKYICYFDIFNHPLTKTELGNYSGLDAFELEKQINALVDSKACFAFDEYFSIQPSVAELVEQRKHKEQQAEIYFKKLKRYTRLIRSFPFVEGIGISGSLSKNVMHDDGDIDYFIITKKGRLWICRTLLVVFKKIFLLNSKKYFCVNYFVDEDNLKIPDHNIFTAIEISHILVVHNADLLQKFKTENEWTDELIAPFQHPIDFDSLSGGSWIGKFISFIFKGKLGDRFDLYLMRFTYKNWEKKFEHFDTKKFDLTMRTNRGVSKHHPRNFQNRVLSEYRKRLAKFGLEE